MQLTTPDEHTQARAMLKHVRTHTFDCLTAREYEVLRLLATGATNAQIARALTLSEGTIRNAIARVTCKLGLADRTQAALLGYRAGVAANVEIMAYDRLFRQTQAQSRVRPLAFDR